MTDKQCKGCPALIFTHRGTPCCQYDFPDEPKPIKAMKECPMEMAPVFDDKDDYD